MSHRTFLAVDLDESLRRMLAGATWKLSAGLGSRDRVNWVAPENLHVTMKFLGDCDGGTLREVCRVACETAAASTPMMLEATGVAFVPSRGPLRMLWAQIADPTGGLAKLAAALDASLADLGFAPEGRAFQAHVTLARIKHVAGDEALRAAGRSLPKPLGAWEATTLTVYTSELTPAGPVYTPTARCPLGG